MAKLEEEKLFLKISSSLVVNCFPDLLMKKEIISQAKQLPNHNWI